ncbi:MAG: hypothetical protein ACFB5Z_07395 [Elainellaceae cyanobacterium]
MAIRLGPGWVLWIVLGRTAIRPYAGAISIGAIARTLAVFIR